MEEKLSLLKKRYGNYKNMNTIGVECLATEIRKVVDETQKQVPVPIATLLDRFGFRLYTEHFVEKGLYAIIGHHDSLRTQYRHNKILKINEELTRESQRQAMAVALAHYIMNYAEDDAYVYGCNDVSSQDEILMGFATALLLPSNTFVADYRQFMAKTEDKEITRQLLRNRYEVTDEFVLFRAKNLGLNLNQNESEAEAETEK